METRKTFNKEKKIVVIKKVILLRINHSTPDKIKDRINFNEKFF